MSTLGIVCSVLGGWIILAVLIAPRLGRMLKRQSVDYVHLVVGLPPVPPPVSRHTDAEWLDAWPAEAVSDTEVAARLDRIVGVR